MCPTAGAQGPSAWGHRHGEQGWPWGQGVLARAARDRPQAPQVAPQQCCPSGGGGSACRLRGTWVCRGAGLRGSRGASRRFSVHIATLHSTQRAGESTELGGLTDTGRAHPPAGKPLPAEEGNPVPSPEQQSGGTTSAGYGGPTGGRTPGTPHGPRPRGRACAHRCPCCPGDNAVLAVIGPSSAAGAPGAESTAAPALGAH